MSCPTCSKTMIALGCKVTDGTFYFCPVCGTIKTCSGEVVVPDLVRRCRVFQKQFAPEAEAVFGDVTFARRWTSCGLDEATYNEDERALAVLRATGVVFGLRAQGHLPTIAALLQAGESWDAIGAQIGWDPATAQAHYEAQQETPCDPASTSGN